MNKKIATLVLVIILVFMGILIEKNGGLITKRNVSEDQALEIASNYLDTKVPAEQINDLEFEEIYYREPSGDDLPGIYKINYARKINGVTSLNGIQMRVNAETGEVSSYRETWSINEDEVAQISNEPDITDKEAVRILKDYMSNAEHIGKEKANSVKVTSSELAWKVDEDDKILNFMNNIMEQGARTC